MPWEKTYDEADVLERAMHAFWAHGYEATSIKDLVEATGINRGSIYAAFESKHALFMQALRHYDRVHREEFLNRISRNFPPRQAIIAAFEGAAKSAEQDGNPGGCLLVNTALELSPHDPDVRDFVETRIRAVEEFFFSNIKAAKQDGSMKRPGASRETAQVLLGLFLGLRVLTRSQPRRAVIEAITSQARAMLE